MTQLRTRLQSLAEVDRIAVILLVAAAFKAFAWAVLNQQVPDEHGYFAEALQIAKTGASQSFTGHIVGVFAYTGAAAIRVGSVFGLDPLLSVRMLGAACSVGVAWIGYRVGRVLSDSDFVALATLILVAFNPMQSFLGSSANSDTMHTLWASAVVLASVLMIVKGPRPVFVGAGILFTTLAYYTKTSRSILVLGLLAAALIISVLLSSKRAISTTRRIRELLFTRAGAISSLLTMAVLVVAWPLYSRYLAMRIPVPFIRTPGPSNEEIVNTLPSIASVFESLWDGRGRTMAMHLWGYFGLLHVPGPPGFYRIHRVLLILAVLGALGFLGRWLWSALSRRGVTGEPDPNLEATRLAAGRFFAQLLLLGAVAVIVYASLEYADHHSIMVQGRYLLTFIVPIYALLAVGISGIVGPRMGSVGVVVLLGFMVFANLWALLYITVPYFY